MPLSAPHYTEMAGIRDPRQRSDVACRDGGAPGFQRLMSSLTVTTLELDAALARVTGTRERFEPLPLIGHGALQAFGMLTPTEYETLYTPTHEAA